MSFDTTTMKRYHGWPPADRKFNKHLIRHHIEHVRGRYNDKAQHIAPVGAFEIAIKSDPEMHDLFHQIFLEAPKENEIDNFDWLLYLIDDAIVKPPRIESVDVGDAIIREPVMAYIGMLFDTISNTSTSYDLFRKPKFNSALKDLLDHWGRYLMDPNDNSNSSLTDHHDGWFSEPLLSMLEGNGRGTFNETYICPDPGAIGRGFATFDAFFTRRLQTHARPVHFPENKSLIHSACESYVYRIAHRVKKHDQFWLKGQYYSLYNMLDRDEEHANQFVGGTVYQAYLSTVDYHRWHAPVDGVVTKTVMVPGTYYAVLPDHGAGPDDPELEEGDPAGAIFRSQAWLTAVSTRALVYIRADNPDIGLMCFMAIGMREVSTCEITVRAGQRVKIGDDLGTFHIGGSSHTMIFQPQAKVTFADHVKINEHIKVKSIIGQVERAA